MPRPVRRTRSGSATGSACNADTTAGRARTAGMPPRIASNAAITARSAASPRPAARRSNSCSGGCTRERTISARPSAVNPRNLAATDHPPAQPRNPAPVAAACARQPSQVDDDRTGQLRNLICAAKAGSTARFSASCARAVRPAPAGIDVDRHQRGRRPDRQPRAPASSTTGRDNASIASATSSSKPADGNRSPAGRRAAACPASSTTTGGIGILRGGQPPHRIRPAPAPVPVAALRRLASGAQPRPLFPLRGPADPNRQHRARGQSLGTLAVGQKPLGVGQRHECAGHRRNASDDAAPIDIADPVRRARAPQRNSPATLRRATRRPEPRPDWWRPGSRRSRHRPAVATQQLRCLEQRQADHAGVAAGHKSDKTGRAAVDRVAAGLALAFARGDDSARSAPRSAG